MRKYHKMIIYSENISTDEKRNFKQHQMFYSQILQNFVPVKKSWYFPTESVLRQVSETGNLGCIDFSSLIIKIGKQNIGRRILQNFQVWNLWQSQWNWSDQLIIFQDSENPWSCKIQIPTTERFSSWRDKNMQAWKATYSNSSCFNLEIENGISPFISLNERSLVTPCNQY